jgi:hypothetical protein
MKNIFIGGVAKSGKSRLATNLCKKYDMNHIPVDYFASSFKHNFPSIGITSNVVIKEESSKLLSLFLSRFIEIVESKDDEYFILDSAHILPQDILKYLDTNKWDIYYIGYPNITPEEKITEIKKYTNGGWVDSRSQEELLEIFNNLIILSKNIEKTCLENNIKFIDTSKEDVLKVFNL